MAIALGGAIARPAAACSICGCGDPLLGVNDPGAITGKLSLELDSEYLRIDAGTDGRPGYTDELTQWSFRANAVYRPIEQLALMLTVPIVTKAIDTVGGGARATTSSLTGLGDVEAGARLSLWHLVDLGVGSIHEIAVTAGTSLPTGPHNSRRDDGRLIDPHGQLGTGGFGPFVGLNYRFETGKWLAFANVTARARTTATYVDTSRYGFGHALLWSVHGQLRPIPRLALDLGFDGRYALADRATDPTGIVEDAVANTGGTVLSLAPGAYLDVVDALWIVARVQVPFYTHLFGEQRVYPSAILGLQYQFP
jgi:hypothetical protein